MPEKLELAATVKAFDDKRGVMRVIASTPAKDRHGEVVLPEAFLADIELVRGGKKNIPFLAQHQHRLHDGSPPVIGRVLNPEIKAGALECEVEFVPAEVSPLGPQYRVAYRDGWMTDVSVGFLPRKKEYRKAESPDAGKDGQDVLHYLEADWIELSATPVGSNPEARRRALDFAEFIGRSFAEDEPVEKRIVRGHKDCPAGKPWAVVSEDGSKLLGCHETKESAHKQLAAIEANKRREVEEAVRDLFARHFPDGEVPMDVLRELCPSCAEAVEAEHPGVTVKKLNLTSNQIAGLCAKLGLDDPGFHRRCTRMMSGKVSDPAAFCSDLHEACLGTRPSEHRRRDAADRIADALERIGAAEPAWVRDLRSALAEVSAKVSDLQGAVARASIAPVMAQEGQSGSHPREEARYEALLGDLDSVICGLRQAASRPGGSHERGDRGAGG